MPSKRRVRRKPMVKLGQEAMSATMARPTDVFGLRILAAVSSLVTVQGSCYVFGNDIQVRWAQAGARDLNVAVGYLRSPLPSWYLIRAPYGATYDLKFGRPGLLAPVEMGQLPAGTEAVSEAPVIRVGSTRALTLSGELPSCATPADTQYNWYNNEPSMGIPGCFVGAGEKSHSAQGTAGFNSLVAGVGGINVYVVLTYQSAFLGNNLQQRPTPAFLAFRATDLPSGVAGAPATGVKMGDLSVLQNPVSVGFVIRHAVTAIGAYFPAAELDSSDPGPPPTGSVYSQWNVSVYTLLAGKSLPYGGGSVDVTTGNMRPCLPGTGFGEQELPTNG